MSVELQDTFLSLVRLGIGTGTVNGSRFTVHGSVDWEALKALADEQGLAAVALDGLNLLNFQPTTVSQLSTLNSQLKLEWIGEVLQGEAVYAGQWEAARGMAEVFGKNDIRTYVLKGFVVSECYPKPNHRVSVDLDSFLTPQQGDFNAWEQGNKLMENAGFEVDRSFYKNSTIMLKGLTVENHQFMTPVRGSKRLKRLERLLQSYIYDDDGKDRFEGTCMYRPPVMVSALFLIEHAYAHFLHEGLTWRMVLDWQMFSRKHKQEIDWYSLSALIDEFGFRKFYDSYNRLGFYLTGEGQEPEGLSVQDKRMLGDVWASLDIHDFHGVKGKMALAGNSIRAAWKYRYFTPDLMIVDLFNRVKGFIFERHPKI